MTNEKFIGFTMEKTKHIALVAHDGKKKELVESTRSGKGTSFYEARNCSIRATLTVCLEHVWFSQGFN